MHWCAVMSKEEPQTCIGCFRFFVPVHFSSTKTILLQHDCVPVHQEIVSAKAREEELERP